MDKTSMSRHTTGDAWGQALVDHLEGRLVDDFVLEVDDGRSGPAMHPEWFFRTEPDWELDERRILRYASAGPALDLGAGAGRLALWLQGRGTSVTAVDSSQGAAEVCARRGVADVRVGDLNDPPTDQAWAVILLMCGNLGLGGSWDGNRRLLSRLAALAAPGAVLLADSVNDDGPAELGLRIRYGDVVTPWWRQRNVSAAEVPVLVNGTGWEVAEQIEAANGVDHYVALVRR